MKKTFNYLFRCSVFVLFALLVNNCSDSKPVLFCNDLAYSLKEKQRKERCSINELPNHLKNIEQILSALDEGKNADTSLANPDIVNQINLVEPQVSLLNEEKSYFFIANYLRHRSEIMFNGMQVETSLATLHQAEKLLDEYAKNRCDSIAQAEVYSYLGISYQNMENFDTAIHYTKKALAFNLKLRRIKKVAVELSNISLPYLRKKSYKIATDYNQQALCIWNEIEKKPEDIDFYLQPINNAAVINSTLGQEYYYNNEKEKAKITFNKSITAFEQIFEALEQDTILNDGDRVGRMIYVLVNMSGCYISGSNRLNGEINIDRIKKIIDFIEKIEQEGVKKYYKLMAYPLLAIFEAEGGACEAADERVMEGIKSAIIELPNSSSLASAEVNYKNQYTQALHLRGRVSEICYTNSKEIIDLKKSFENYFEAVKFIENWRNNLASDQAKKDVINLWHLYYDKASAMASKLFELTGDEYFYDTAFDIVDRRKSIALKEGLKLNGTNLSNGILKGSENEALDISKIQQEWLDNETAIIAYSLGYHESFAFLLTNNQKELVAIKEDSILFQVIDEYAKTLQNKLGYFQNESYFIYEKLITPFSKTLKSNQIKKLVIVPDGIINDISFAALLTEPSNKDTSFAKLPYLVKDYAISYTPSLSISDMLLEKEVALKKNTIFNAFIANPANIKFVETDASKAFKQLDTIDAIDKETNKIVQNYFKMNSLKENATKKDFLTDAPNASIVHLALHGFMNETTPLDSYFAFMPEGTNNGTLSLKEIYNLTINADLIYLASCNASRGKIEEVEGMISPANAFLHAGCKGVIGSMTAEEDEKIALITQLFYAEFLNGELSVNEALQTAQLKYLEMYSDSFKNDLVHPANWANYRYIGIDGFNPLIFLNLSVN